MPTFVLSDDDADLLLFLDRFRVSILAWADILEVSEAECRILALDYARLQDVLCPLARPVVQPSERCSVPNERINMRRALSDIRVRLTRLIARIEAHTAYTVRIAVDLCLISESHKREFVLVSPLPPGKRHVTVEKLPASLRN